MELGGKSAIMVFDDVDLDKGEHLGTPWKATQSLTFLTGKASF